MVEHELLDKLAARFIGRNYADLTALEAELAEMLLGAGYLWRGRSNTLYAPKTAKPLLS